jgi:hypothetical protein
MYARKKLEKSSVLFGHEVGEGLTLRKTDFCPLVSRFWP